MLNTTPHPDRPRASQARLWLGALILLLGLLPATRTRAADSALVFLTDFSVRDGAVSAMKGVAFGVDPRLREFDFERRSHGIQCHPGAGDQCFEEHIARAKR